MSVLSTKLRIAIVQAQELGGWPNYAVHMLGDCDTGSPELDSALAELYRANETVHRLANQLCLRHGVSLFEGN